MGYPTDKIYIKERARQEEDYRLRETEETYQTRYLKRQDQTTASRDVCFSNESIKQCKTITIKVRILVTFNRKWMCLGWGTHRRLSDWQSVHS